MMPDDLKLAPEPDANAQLTFKDHAGLERFWQELYSKVKTDLERWEEARMKSEEGARNLWLRRCAEAGGSSGPHARSPNLVR